MFPWAEWFPDAPAWIPAAALAANVVLLLVFAAAFVANPLDRWAERKFREDAGPAPGGIPKASSQLAGLALTGVPIAVIKHDDSD